MKNKLNCPADLQDNNQNMLKLLPLILGMALLLSACQPSADNPTVINWDQQYDESNSKSSSKSYGKDNPAMVIIGEDGTKAAGSSASEKVDSDTSGQKENSENNFQGYELSEADKNDPRVKCIETKSQGKVVMDFAGDICFDDGYSNMSKFRSGGETMSAVLSSNLLSELTDADIYMENNEFPYSSGGSPLAGKTYTFRAKPSRVSLLKEMGVDIVTLANNHAYDYGQQALLDTFDTLDGADIPYVGAGKNIEEASKPFYFIAGGMKIAFVAATQIERTQTPDTKEATENSAGVLRTLDPTRFLTVIEEADKNADLTVVYVHWGTENQYDVEASQRDLATKYAEAGADLIIGDHSHCLQGFEYVKDVPVVYSLGNFWFNSKTRDTCVVQAVAEEGQIRSVRFLPCRQHDCRTDMYEKGDSEYTRILGVMQYLSYDVSIDENGYISNGAGHGVNPVTPETLAKPSYQMTDEEKAAAALQQMNAAQMQQTEAGAGN